MSADARALGWISSGAFLHRGVMHRCPGYVSPGLPLCNPAPYTLSPDYKWAVSHGPRRAGPRVPGAMRQADFASAGFIDAWCRIYSEQSTTFPIQIFISHTTRLGADSNGLCKTGAGSSLQANVSGVDAARNANVCRSSWTSFSGKAGFGRSKCECSNRPVLTGAGSRPEVPKNR